MNNNLGLPCERRIFSKMLRGWFFCFCFGVAWWLGTMLLAAAPAGLGFIPRADWFGDPYLLTNPPGNALSPFRISVVLNPELTTNLDYQGKVNALVASVAPDQKDAWADIAEAAAVSLQEGKRSAQIVRAAGTAFVNQAAAVPAATNGVGDDGSWLLPVKRWSLFGLVALFLARRLWRYFCEVEEDDDFADHLATLAVAHRWIFPVYIALLTAVAGVEFFEIGNLFFSLSLLLLASSLRRYYCESDFADFPLAQKFHLAMSLALVALGWLLGNQNYLAASALWFHWPVFAWIMLALIIETFSQFYNHADLAEHRKDLYFFLCGFLVLGLLGGGIGYHLWQPAYGGSPYFLGLLAGVVACVPLGLYFIRWSRNVSEQVVGRTLFDMIFSYGHFAEKTRKKKHLPEVLLLRHWRDHGEVEKAWQTAQSHLFKEARALPVWLFALETAVLYRQQPGEALEILKRLCAVEEIHFDHRTVAVAQVQAWMTAAGFEFDATPFKLKQAPLPPTALTNKVGQKYREGRFGEAVLLLRDVLEKDQLNEPAFIQLVRVYAQDLKNRPAAEKLIAGAAETFSPTLLDFLSRSLDEWLQAPIRSQIKSNNFPGQRQGAGSEETDSKKVPLISPPITQPPAPLKTDDHLTTYLKRVKAAQGQPPDTSLVQDQVEKLLLERRLGTAVELIKQQAEAQPDNFDLWLRYAEAHGHHCGDLNTAEKIIRRMDRSGHFKKAQMKKVHARLKKWHKKHPNTQVNW